MQHGHESRAEIAAERASIEVQIANLDAIVEKLRDIEMVARMHHQTLRFARGILERQCET